MPDTIPTGAKVVRLFSNELIGREIHNLARPQPGLYHHIDDAPRLRVKIIEHAGRQDAILGEADLEGRALVRQRRPRCEGRLGSPAAKLLGVAHTPEHPAHGTDALVRGPNLHPFVDDAILPPLPELQAVRLGQIG